MQHFANNDPWPKTHDSLRMAFYKKATSGAREALKAMEPKKKKHVETQEVDPIDIPYFPTGTTAFGIVQEILEHRGVHRREIMSDIRTDRVVRARHEIAYWLRRITLLSYPQIADRMGCSEHSGAIYGSGRHASRFNLLPVSR